MRKLALALVAGVCLLLGTTSATLAYDPFDGAITDAAREVNTTAVVLPPSPIYPTDPTMPVNHGGYVQTTVQALVLND